MTYVLTFSLVVAAMLAPYGLAAGLTAALPDVRRRFGDFPSTGQLVGRFFDGSEPDAAEGHRARGQGPIGW